MNPGDEPAFPLPPCPQCGTDHEPTHISCGLTKREYAAIQIHAELVATSYASEAIAEAFRVISKRTGSETAELVATVSVANADALLTELAKPQEETNANH